MLEQMRKHMNWIMWMILVIIIVTFLFFGIYPSASQGDTAARVNGDIITRSEYNRVYRNTLETYRQIFKDQFSEALAKNLRQQVLRDLISSRLLIQEARRVGLKVSDEEVQAAIMKIPAFSNQGKFDRVAYERYLDYINQKPSAFEEGQREYLLKQKLELMIEDGVDVTDAEAASAYAAKTPKAKAGEFEKNKAGFKQSLLAEKKRSALEAYVQGLQKKATIKANEEALEL